MQAQVPQKPALAMVFATKHVHLKRLTQMDVIHKLTQGLVVSGIAKEIAKENANANANETREDNADEIAKETAKGDANETASEAANETAKEASSGVPAVGDLHALALEHLYIALSKDWSGTKIGNTKQQLLSLGTDEREKWVFLNNDFGWLQEMASCNYGAVFDVKKEEWSKVWNMKDMLKATQVRWSGGNMHYKIVSDFDVEPNNERSMS